MPPNPLLILLTTSLVASSSVLAVDNCRLNGPSFPAPTLLTRSTTISSATKRLASIFDASITTFNSSYGPFDAANITYSLEIFSIHSERPILSRHHTSKATRSSKVGTTQVTSDSVYRIGSLTKLFAAYVSLITAGDVVWRDPVTKYIPELAEADLLYNATANPIDHVSWSDVTLGDLAAHTSGVGRELGGFRELTGPLSTIPDPTIYGLPPLNKTELPICAGGGFCTRKTFFEGFTKRHPVYAPATGAIYSNVAYQILAYAIENVTGVDFPTLVQKNLYKPLNLSKSSWGIPPKDNKTSVISNPAVWALDLGDETP